MAALTNSNALAKQVGNLFRARRPRTSQHVRRNSYHAGDRETRAWVCHNTFGRDENNARLRAAEKFDQDTKLPGKRNGKLGHIALEVYRLLLRLRGRGTGRLDPSYAWIAKRLHRSRSAVVSAAHRLKEHGFLDWIRRTQLVEDPDSDQYVEQIPNAFLLTLSKKAAAIVARIMRRPTEAQQRKAEEADRRERYERPITDEELAAIETPEIREALERTRAPDRTANPPSGHNGAMKG